MWTRETACSSQHKKLTSPGRNFLVVRRVAALACAFESNCGAGWRELARKSMGDLCPVEPGDSGAWIMWENASSNDALDSATERLTDLAVLAQRRLTGSRIVDGESIAPPSPQVSGQQIKAS